MKKFLLALVAILPFCFGVTPAHADCSGGAVPGMVVGDNGSGTCTYLKIGTDGSISVSGGTLSGLVGVKGTDGTNIAAPGNPLDVRDINSASILAGVTGAIPTNQSGVVTAVTGCDKFATYDASDNGKKTVITGVSAKKTYICGWMVGTGGTATNLSLGTGTGADCVTTFVASTPAWQLAANQRTGMNSPFYNGHALGNAADNVCVQASAGNAHQVLIYYTQY